jgi:hypothetical protein
MFLVQLALLPQLWSDWGVQFGTSSNDYSTEMTTDKENNIYLTGYTNGSLSGSNVGNTDIWIAKYNTNGTQIWIKQFGSTLADNSQEIGTDSKGNIYIGGSTSGDIANTNIGNEDIWLAKYDSNGNQVWKKQFGTKGYDLLQGMAIDTEGNIYLSGYTNDNFNLTDSNAGHNDIWIAKYDEDGKEKWVKQFGSAGEDYLQEIALDLLGNIYMTGYTEGSLVGSGKNTGASDIWFAKYNSAGTQQWIQQFGSIVEDFSYGITVDSIGNIYLTGITFGSLTGTNAGASDIWFAKYTNNGIRQWIKQFGTTLADNSQGVIINSAGNIYLTGFTKGSLTGTNAGNEDIWLAKYYSNGNQIWKTQFGSSAKDFSYGITADSQGNAYMTGTSLGYFFNSNAGSSDVWLKKIDTIPPIEINISIPYDNNDCIYGGIKTVTGVDENNDSNLIGDEIIDTKDTCFNIPDTLERNESLLFGDVNCFYGGIKTLFGLDKNRDGNLSYNEVDDSYYICDESKHSLIETSFLSNDTNCSNGGSLIKIGFDLNYDGQLQNNEIVNSLKLCNGTNGSNGTNGKNSIVKTTLISAGAICLNGGSKIEAGLDLNSNNVLDSNEITSSTNICNGTTTISDSNGTSGNGSNGINGKNSIIKTTIISAGAICLNGGSKIEAGLDFNGNNILDIDEITSSSNICNGLNGSNYSNGTGGTNGSNGTNGQNSIIKTTAITDANICINGGTLIQTGLDKNYNNILELDEVENSQTLCLAIQPITENITVEKLTNLELKKGWNLIALDKNLSNISSSISIIWQQLADGNWSAFSPSGEHSASISSNGFRTISQKLSAKNGTWFLANKDINISNEPPLEVNGSVSPSFPNLSGKLGWNLMGATRTIPAKALYCSEGSKTVVWKYKNNQWLLFVENIDPILYPNMFEKLELGQGFWLLCK